MAQNPALAVIHQTDALASDFRNTHAATAPVISQLRVMGEQQGDDAAREAPVLMVLREALERLEHDVEVSADLESLRPQIQRAQDHVSQAVDAYQNELLSKRKLLYQFAAETYDTDQFCDLWSRLDELSSGTKLDVDALADLLGGLGGI